MRTKMKKGIIALCALSMMATLPVAVMSMNNANAETIVATTDGFYMEEGAAVRTTSDELGIRFSATITQTYWQELQATYGEDATYNFYSVVTDGVKPITKNYVNVTPNFTEESSYTFYSTIVYKTADLENAGLLEKACNISLSAQTYVDVTKAGETEAVTLAAYGQTGSRSMKAVANAAFLAGETDEELAKYFTVGNRSEKVEGYSFTDKSGGVVTMSAMPAWTDDMEVYYGAEKLSVTYENGTVSFDAISFDAEKPYISVFNGSTVYSAKVTEALKITQENITSLQSITGTETIYLAENVTLSADWTTMVDFKGTFDGGNHSITGFTPAKTKGLFNTASGIIKNVAFVNANLKYGNNAVIAYRLNGSLTVENVFVSFIRTGTSTGSRFSVITERALDANNTVNLTNMVIKMCGTTTTESIFGYQIQAKAYLTNVYTINIQTKSPFPYAQNINTTPVATNCGYYADLTAFNGATKTLTSFLTSCVEQYLNA